MRVRTGRLFVVPPLLLACTCANVFFDIDRIHIQTLSPHKFTPMTGVHNDMQADTAFPLHFRYLLPSIKEEIDMNLEVIVEKPASVTHPTPILFVHGMWHAAWCWKENFLPYFSQHGYAAYALSLRAHGGSEGRKGLRWASLKDYVSDVAQVAGQLETPPILVGHSMGGMIVQKYLESGQAPAAVLLASVPPGGVMPATVRVFLRHPWAVTKAILTLSMFPVVSTPRLAQEAFFSADMPEDKIMSYFAQLQDESFRAYMDMMVFNLPRTKRIKAPLLVLGAENDMTISPKEVAGTGRAYGVEAEFFPGMTHDMMLEEDWRVVADRMLAWLGDRGL